MSYEAKMVLDSIGPNGARLSTIRLCYPMRVHWDLLTHRVFSRNASSGRSISVTRMVHWLDGNVSKPLSWLADGKSMKSSGELPALKADLADIVWQEAYEDARKHALRLEAIGVHRQDANALLIPFGWINVLVTSTTFDNFLCLRATSNARPEMERVAVGIGKALRDSEATPLREGEWHLPFITEDEWETFPIADLLKLSVSRCGHLTNQALDTPKVTHAHELGRYDRFLEECAWSTFEHQAQPQEEGECRRSGNFLGWDQYRQSLPKSVHHAFDYATLDQFEDRKSVV